MRLLYSTLESPPGGQIWWRTSRRWWLTVLEWCRLSISVTHSAHLRWTTHWRRPSSHWRRPSSHWWRPSCHWGWPAHRGCATHRVLAAHRRMVRLAVEVRLAGRRWLLGWRGRRWGLMMSHSHSPANATSDRGCTAAATASHRMSTVRA